MYAASRPGDRTTDDDLPHVTICGWWLEQAGSFGSRPKLIEKCISDLTLHILTTGLPYHERYLDPHRLLKAPKDVTDRYT